MDKLEKVAVLDNEIQAQRLAQVLTERGIPHLMQSYHDSAYDGLFQAQKGWGHVEAPAQFKGEVLVALNDIQHPPQSLE